MKVIEKSLLTLLNCVFLLFFQITTAYAGELTGADDINPAISADIQQKLDIAVLTYYQAPSLDKINTVLDLITNTDVLRKRTAWPTMIGFLTVIFEHNTDHIADFISRNDYNTHAQDVMITALLHAKQKESALTFAKGEQWKPEEVERIKATQDDIDLTHLTIIVPGHIDTLWGAFFASGDAVYVDQIINVLFLTKLPPQAAAMPVPEGYDLLDEDKKLAHDTLKRYAASQPKIRYIIETHIKVEKDAKNKALLEKLLVH